MTILEQFTKKELVYQCVTCFIMVDPNDRGRGLTFNLLGLDSGRDLPNEEPTDYVYEELTWMNDMCKCVHTINYWSANWFRPIDKEFHKVLLMKYCIK